MNTKDARAGLRLFVAVQISPSIKKQIHAEWVRPLVKAYGGRGTREENLHITLQFLGDVSHERIPALRKALQEAADDMQGFSARGETIGFFGKMNAATLWMGFGWGEAQLICCMQRIESALRPLGFGGSREYKPHITLARQAQLQARSLQAKAFVPLAINNITLYQSLRVQGRLTYRPLCTQTLRSTLCR